nr:putative ribonuclease H-like domain-containing protein [Tanacetum cinerariifolium]
MCSKGKIRSVDYEVNQFANHGSIIRRVWSKAYFLYVMTIPFEFLRNSMPRRKELLVYTWLLHVNFIIEITMEKGIVDVKLLDRRVVDGRNSKVGEGMGGFGSVWVSKLVGVEELLVEGIEVDGEILVALLLVMNMNVRKRLRKLRPDEARAAIERLAPYEDEGWNDALIPDEVSLDYENPDIEQLLGIMERKVTTLMKDAISLIGKSESVFRLTANEMYRPSSERSRKEEFEHIVMNFLFDQEERITQLKDYMQVIAEEFMEFSSKAMSKRVRSTRGQASSSREETMEEKVRKFRLFNNENHQMNYNNLAGRSIHHGDIVDWKFLSNKGVIDSGCSRHMIENMSYLSEYEEIDGGYVAFGGDPKGGKITGKGKISTCKLDFKDVYFVKVLKFNLFSVSQMCDKKNNVLFTNTECVILSPDFKLLDESQVLLRVPRKNNMYSVDLKNVAPSGCLTCLFAKATLDEYNLWHRRLGHINFKTMNKLKGKQHKASCKTKTVSSINQPLQMLHMDLFGPTFVKSLMKKMYCLVVTDDYSRFSWVFFLATKDETSGILKAFITGIENLIDHKVKIIRCDNGTKFKNKEMNQFCEKQGIKKEFSVARTSQQNEVVERKNKTLIKVARTMLDDSQFPTTFWAEAVNTACYVQNRVLVIKPHNKTPYELFHDRTPSLSFMRPFRCLVTILNTLDPLGSGPTWLFDIDTLTKSINYKLVITGNQSNGSTGKARIETIPDKDYILLPLWTQDLLLSSSSRDSPGDGFKPLGEEEKKDAKDLGNKDNEDPITKEPRVNQEKDNVNNTNRVNAISSTVNGASYEVNVVSRKSSIELPKDPNMTDLKDISIFKDSNKDIGAKADMTNLDTNIPVSPIPTT